MVGLFRVVLGSVLFLFLLCLFSSFSGGVLGSRLVVLVATSRGSEGGGSFASGCSGGDAGGLVEVGRRQQGSSIRSFGRVRLATLGAFLGPVRYGGFTVATAFQIQTVQMGWLSAD